MISTRLIPLVFLALLVGGLGCSPGIRGIGGPAYLMKGTVEDPDGQPMPWASVALGGSPVGAPTNEDGEFGIDRVREGVYDFTVLYLGYRSESVRIRVPGTNETTVTLSMKPSPRTGPPLVESVPPVTVKLRIEPSS